MGEIKVVAAPPAALISQWLTVEPLLAKSMPTDLGRFQPIDILAAVIRGEGQAWLILEGETILAVTVTKIQQYPRSRGFHFFCLSGERMAEWFDQAEAFFTDYAVKNGCDHMELQGRKGWERVLDYTSHAIILTKDLRPEARTNNAHQEGEDAD